MMMPSKPRYRKVQRGRNWGNAKRGTKLAFGEIGIQAMDRGNITARQIEAGRIAITRKVKRVGRLWIRVFPDKPVTKKPVETRMGKGKGAPEYWVSVIKPGRIIFEMEGVPPALALEAFQLAQAKLPFPTKIVHRTEGLV